MMKELQQNKEELRKMKESFHDKLEELEKENSRTSKVIHSEEVRVSFLSALSLQILLNAARKVYESLKEVYGAWDFRFVQMI